MAARTPLITGETYHCFNRGTDKRVVFECQDDYERFMALLYACNGTKTIRISDRRDSALASILSDTAIDRGEPLVEIDAYSLMPTHPHLVLKQLQDAGIARFLQKVFTGYTMYFNLKNGRTGALFAGVFKSKHVTNDDYLKRLVAYVLLNPAELFEPRWKEGIADLDRLEKTLSRYRYSSLPDFMGKERRENRIISPIADLYDRVPALPDLLTDANAYYREHNPML